MYRKISLRVAAIAFVFAVAGCNKWKDATTVAQQDLTVNLLQAISSNPDLSKFRQYVAQAGLDSVLQVSKTFTVWAPTNTAIQALDPAVVSDPVKLKAFIFRFYFVAK